MSKNNQFKKDIERLKEKSSLPLKEDKPSTSKSDKNINKTPTGTFYKVNSSNEPFKETETKTTQIPVSNYRKSNQLVKKLSLAILSALIIGTMSGIIILNIITPPEDNSSHGNVQPVTHEQGDENNDVPNEDLLINYEFPTLHAYMLQLGVFSDAINAEQFVQSLDNHSIPTVIWPEEGLQYVFTGLAADKETMKQTAETEIDESIEWFVKEWTSDPFQKSITADDKEWIESFIIQWEQSLTDQQPIDQEQAAWKILLDNFPEGSDLLSPFAEHIKKFTNNDLEKHFQIDEFLILTWLMYTKLQN